MKDFKELDPLDPQKKPFTLPRPSNLNELDELDELDEALDLNLQYIDHLLSSAPMVSPPPDFVSRFEVRLEQRINRRRTRLGIIVIGFLLTLAAGLMLWTVAPPGLAFFNTLLNTEVVNALLAGTVNALQSVAASLSVLLRWGLLLAEGSQQIMRHPAFWGFASLSLGTVWLWAQVLRRFSLNQQTLSA